VGAHMVSTRVELPARTTCTLCRTPHTHTHPREVLQAARGRQAVHAHREVRKGVWVLMVRKEEAFQADPLPLPLVRRPVPAADHNAGSQAVQLLFHTPHAAS